MPMYVGLFGILLSNELITQHVYFNFKARIIKITSLSWMMVFQELRGMD